MKTCLKMICSPWQRLVQIQNLVNHEYLFVQQKYLHVLHLMWLSCYQGLVLRYLHVLHLMWLSCYQGLGLKYLHVLHLIWLSCYQGLGFKYLHVLHLMWLSCYQGLGLKYIHVLHPVPSPCSHQRFYSIIFSRLEIVGVHQCFTKHAYLLFFKFIWNALPEQSYLLYFLLLLYIINKKHLCLC